MSLNYGESCKILMKTTPYILLRIMVYGIMGLGAGLFLGLFILLAKVFGGAGGILFVIGLGALAGLMRLAKRYLLYLVKAGHVAVITELIHKGKLPDGVNQVEYGRQVVTKLFKEVSVLFVVDQLVSGIIRAFNRVVVRILDLIPIPGLDSVAKIITSIINFSLTFVDESILSYSLSRSEANLWESSKRGVILYAQNWKPILQASVGLAILNLLGALLMIGLMLVPFGLAALAGGPTWKTICFILAITIGYGLKLSLINPFCMISMVLTYNQAIAGQEPNPEWESKLDSVSSKFRELKSKAASASAPQPLAPAPGPA